VGVLEDAREPDVVEDGVPVEGVDEVAEGLVVDDAGDVVLVREDDRLRVRDAELRSERGAEELVVGAPHERVVEDGHDVERGVLEVGPVERDLVRDPVDEDVVGARHVHPRRADLDELRYDALVAAVDLLDERGRERPLPPDDETDALLLLHGLCGFDGYFEVLGTTDGGPPTSAEEVEAAVRRRRSAVLISRGRRRRRGSSGATTASRAPSRPRGGARCRRPSPRAAARGTRCSGGRRRRGRWRG